MTKVIQPIYSRLVNFAIAKITFLLLNSGRLHIFAYDSDGIFVILQRLLWDDPSKVLAVHSMTQYI